MEAELVKDVLTEDTLLFEQQKEAKRYSIQKGLEEDKAGLHIPQEEVEREMEAILWS
jgi:hypothetical protein